MYIIILIHTDTINNKCKARNNVTMVVVFRTNVHILVLVPHTDIAKDVRSARGNLESLAVKNKYVIVNRVFCAVLNMVIRKVYVEVRSFLCVALCAVKRFSVSQFLTFQKLILQNWCF